MKKKRFLHVLMNGVEVGLLEKTGQGGVVFSYKTSWLDTPGARPISLSLPLLDKPYIGDLVYNFFDNLLPDNPQLRARIQSKFSIATTHPFDLLACIGKDCVGAIQLLEAPPENTIAKINAQPLNEKEIAKRLQGYLNFPLGMGDYLDDFRLSIAGAQEKTAFLFHKKKWHVPLGDTPTTHIFKLPIGYIQHQNIDLHDSCENEWLCTQIAKAFGLPVADNKIMKFNGTKVLVVERFDRRLSKDKSWMMRLPQEDLCQALGVSSNLKYQGDGGPGIQNVMNLLLGAKNSKEDRDYFFRAQILFWLLAAIDGHAKNFSLFIEPNGLYALTPLYDIMSAYPLISKKHLQAKKIKMAMALKGKNQHYHWHNAMRRHFIQTASNVGYSGQRAEDILDEMLFQVDPVIAKVSNELPKYIPQEIAQPIFEGMQAMSQRLCG